MELPRLNQTKQYQNSINTFLGINQGEVIKDGEFSFMKNLSSDKYPVLSARPRRGQVKDIYDVYDAREIISAIEKDEKICMVVNGEGGKKLFYDEQEVMFVYHGEHLIPMGAYICIFPDRVWFNTATGEYGSMESSFGFDNAALEAQEREDISTLCSVAPCDVNGEVPEESIFSQDTVPSEPVNGMLWLDTSAGDAGEYVMRRYDEAYGMWIETDSNYAAISWVGIDKYFEKGDTIIISGFENTDRILTKDIINGEHLIVAKDTDKLIINVAHPFARVEAQFSDTNQNLKIERKVPDMDYVIECDNRLWGCKYGEVEGVMLNEIYASKLGDFKNWYSFEGISTDSYTLSLGSDGPFTGAINYQGYPLFFKEDCIHRIYGKVPSAFQLSTTNCRGVEAGSRESLCVVDEVLFYKSRQDICAYDGSLPMGVSAALTQKYRNAVAGAHGSKLYVSMCDEQDRYHLFVYDTKRGLWHREDETKVFKFFNAGGDLQFIANDKIYSVSGNGVAESQLDWEAVTGVIGYAYPEKKYLSRFTIRAGMVPGSSIKIYVEYDSSGRWEYAGEVKGIKTSTYLIPVRPKRCDHMRIKLVGTGECKIFSFTKVLELGSDY